MMSLPLSFRKRQNAMDRMSLTSHCYLAYTMVRMLLFSQDWITFTIALIHHPRPLRPTIHRLVIIIAVSILSVAFPSFSFLFTFCPLKGIFLQSITTTETGQSRHNVLRHYVLTGHKKVFQ
ncbi:hypothetical protein BDF20DRAFT_865705 [Mycotypha africana]|uniref:uncharacterized protein n=1 Tax=Mycotypha africana TaxID=64632 RepID=UPI0023012644|nr:uncharacterized protein BDF20DRAFT_865705 [Mycotypha africana]KAI8982227.1 hypothetical protein BDF20DRAFT_865705 [Mycotypha africana]